MQLKILGILLGFVFSVSAAQRTNVLLFTADDLHAESLGVYGGKPLHFAFRGNSGTGMSTVAKL